MSASPRQTGQPPVRSILRALRVLVELNNRTEATAAELARAVDLPRPTVHRILETLVAAGYVNRSPDDQRYRPDASVAQLSLGYAEEDWLRKFALEPMRRLAKDTGLDVALAVQSGLSMLVRGLSGTDVTHARLVLEGRAPMLGSASGLLCLAYVESGHRELLLRRLAWSDDPLDRQSRNTAAVTRLLDLTAERGYAVSYRSPESEYSQVLAVPVLPEKRFLAALVLRLDSPKLTHEQVVHDYLHALQRAADLIREGFEHRVEALAGAIQLQRPAAGA